MLEPVSDSGDCRYARVTRKHVGQIDNRKSSIGNRQ